MSSVGLLSKGEQVLEVFVVNQLVLGLEGN